MLDWEGCFYLSPACISFVHLPVCVHDSSVRAAACQETFDKESFNPNKLSPN